MHCFVFCNKLDLKSELKLRSVDGKDGKLEGFFRAPVFQSHLSRLGVENSNGFCARVFHGGKSSRSWTSAESFLTTRSFLIARWQLQPGQRDAGARLPLALRKKSRNFLLDTPFRTV